MRQWHHARFDHYRDRKGTVTAVTASEVKDVFMDIGLCSGEKVIVFTLESGARHLHLQDALRAR